MTAAKSHCNRSPIREGGVETEAARNTGLHKRITPNVGAGAAHTTPGLVVTAASGRITAAEHVHATAHVNILLLLGLGGRRRRRRGGRAAATTTAATTCARCKTTRWFQKT